MPSPNRTFRLAALLALFPAALASASFTPPANVQGADAVTGKPVELRLRDAAKASVIVFVSAKCPCSMSHEGALRDLAKEFSTQGFQFVAVHSNTDEPAEIAEPHFQAAGFPFPVVQDRDAKIANTWGALKTPHVFVVNAQGEVLYQGGVDDSHVQSTSTRPYLRDALVAIQAGQKPEISRTRSLGCAIKR